MDTIVDLITPPPSPDKENAAAQHPMPAASKKRSADMAGIECIEDSSDDEDVFVGQLARPAATSSNAAAAAATCHSDANATTDSSAAAASSSSDSRSSDYAAPAANPDEDEELQFVGRKGEIALSDFPHARQNCVNHRFVAGNEHKHCPQCFCFVCDAPADTCAQWREHCAATHADAKWVEQRKQAQEAAARAAAKAAAASAAAASAAGGGPSDGSGVTELTCEQLLDAITQVYPHEDKEPEGLAPGTALKPYQKQSLAFMHRLETTTDAALIGVGPTRTGGERRGGWLCDEVGMGKTLVCISLILAHKAQKPSGTEGLTVVVVPPTLLGQWHDELRKFAPSLRIATYHGSAGGVTGKASASGDWKEAVLRQLASSDVVLTSYGMDLGKRIGHRANGANGVWRLIVDEAHLGAQTKQTRANLEAFKARFVWLLTGTPVSSSVTDLSFGYDQLLGAPPVATQAMSDVFSGGFPNVAAALAAGRALAAALRQLMIRHTKSQQIGGEAALALPEKDVSVVWLTMSRHERELYEQACTREAHRLAQLLQLKEGAPGHRLELSVAIRRQACSNAYKLTSGFSDEQRGAMYETPTSYLPRLQACTKIGALLGDLTALRTANPAMQAVVFTHYVDVHRAIVAALEAAHFDVSQVSGATDMAHRAAAIRSFQGSGGHAAAGGAKASSAGGCTWVQCDGCQRWRRLHGVKEEELPESWRCSMHPRAPSLSCATPEDQMEDGEEMQDDGSTSAAPKAGAAAAGAAAAPARSGKVFVFTVKLGSVGVTLTAATRVYMMEPAFDPSAETKEVLIRKFAFKESLEESIVELHGEISKGKIAIKNGAIPPHGLKLLAKVYPATTAWQQAQRQPAVVRQPTSASSGAGLSTASSLAGKYTSRQGTWSVERSGALASFSYVVRLEGRTAQWTALLSGTSFTVRGFEARGTILSCGDISFADGGYWKKARPTPSLPPNPPEVLRASVDLPPGWTARVSRNTESGQIYYAHAIFGSTWQRPQPLPLPSALPSGWKARYSTSKPGQVVYEHQIHGSTWERPRF